MLLSLDDYRRCLHSTYDAVARAADELEAQDAHGRGRDVIGANSRYRQARERERARRAANWFTRGDGSSDLEE
jgi:hypothetical protein